MTSAGSFPTMTFPNGTSQKLPIQPAATPKQRKPTEKYLQCRTVTVAADVAVTGIGVGVVAIAVITSLLLYR